MLNHDAQDGYNWMASLLKSPVFSNLPPANLQKIIINLNQVNFQQGEKIINQDDQGDYFYIIKQGECLISRKPSTKAKQIILGRLGQLDTFGEDALISEQPRNVDITAITEVCLLSLEKALFINLIKKPSLKFLDYGEMKNKLNKGAKLVDVSEVEDFRNDHLPLSINIPFFCLRMKLKSLDNRSPIILTSRDDKISETAAFILLRHKFNTFILKGGFSKINRKLSTFEETPEIESKNYLFEQQLIPINPLSKENIEKITDSVIKLESQYAKLLADKKKLESQYLMLSNQLEVMEKIVNKSEINN